MKTLTLKPLIIMASAIVLGVAPDSQAVVKGQRVKSNTPIAQSTVAVYNDMTGTFCTGTLISDHWVLTAAHCLTKNWKKLSGDIKPKSLTIIFGEFEVSSFRNSTRANFIQKHPEFGGAEKVKTADRNDVALVRFDSKLPKNFAPLPLLSEEEFHNMQPGTEVVIAGYGMTSLKDRSTEKKLFSFATTYQSTDERFAVARLVPYPDKPGGNCPGDSGGPAFLVIEDKYYVWGVASTAEVSCEKFGEYGNITHYTDWVKQTMEQNK